MARHKGQNLSNRNQCYLTTSDPNSPITVRPGYCNTPESKNDLKSHPMMMIEDDKKDINNSPQEIWDNTDKWVEKGNPKIP